MEMDLDQMKHAKRLGRIDRDFNIVSILQQPPSHEFGEYDSTETDIPWHSILSSIDRRTSTTVRVDYSQRIS